MGLAVKLRHFLGARLYTNAYFLIANTFTGLVLGLAFWAVAARLYDDDEVGVGAGLLASMTLIALLSQAGLGIGLVRHLPSMRDTATRLVNTSIVAATGSALLLAVLLESSVGLWSSDLAGVLHHPVVGPSFAVLVAVYAVFTLQNSVFIAHRRTRFVPAQNFIVNAGKIALVVPLATLGAYGVFLSMGFAAVLALLVTLVWFLPAVQPDYAFRPTFDMNAVRRLWRFSIQNHVVEVFGAAPVAILPLMIVASLGPEANAYFYVSWLMAGAMLTGAMALAASLLAEGSHEEDRLQGHVRRALLMALLMTVPGAGIVAVAAAPLLTIFGGNYVDGASAVLRILALSTIPSALNVIYFSFERVRGKMARVLAAQFVAVASAIVLFYVLTPTMGVEGAAVAWLVGQTIVALLWAAPVLVKDVFAARVWSGAEISELEPIAVPANQRNMGAHPWK
jgi:O-antigen/teichoic acid export membrane protein